MSYILSEGEKADLNHLKISLNHYKSLKSLKIPKTTLNQQKSQKILN
jgi:hypothetical protein